MDIVAAQFFSYSNSIILLLVQVLKFMALQAGFRVTRILLGGTEIARVRFPRYSLCRCGRGRQRCVLDYGP